jgi:TM2 domain-containing membrane protein YozV
MISRAALSCPSCGRPSAAVTPVYHAPPHMLVTHAYQPVLVTHTKSRGVYIVLALFFGCLGVHNFYAGYNGRGAAQLIITLLTGCAGGFVLTALWAFIECLVIDTDPYGRRMT